MIVLPEDIFEVRILKSVNDRGFLLRAIVLDGDNQPREELFFGDQERLMNSQCAMLFDTVARRVSTLAAPTTPFFHIEEIGVQE